MDKIRPKTVAYSHISLAMQMARENENLTLTPYHDTVGKLTIGYGRNLEGRGIRHSEAELMLANDVLEAHDTLLWQLSFYGGLDEIRQALFMDLYHNMGMGGLLTFKKMLRAAQIENWTEAATQLKDSKYFLQTGRRAMRNYCIMKFGRLYTFAESEAYFRELMRQ